MENQKELLLTYEQTLAHKDSIVANITEDNQKQVSSIFILTFLSGNRPSGGSRPLLPNSNSNLIAKTANRRANSKHTNLLSTTFTFYMYVCVVRYFEISHIYTVCISQKERSELMKAFTLWKIRHCDEKREVRYLFVHVMVAFLFVYHQPLAISSEKQLPYKQNN